MLDCSIADFAFCIGFFVVLIGILISGMAYVTSVKASFDKDSKSHHHPRTRWRPTT
jgi:hypothetical protein